MDKRIVKIREEERKYHEACYDQYRLFEAGSWLYKPVRTVMDTLAVLDSRESLSVLDLGCGVGRNSIPIAGKLQGRKGKVVCVDLLESAITKLEGYSETHGVGEYIEAHVSDIGEYEIAENAFDYIVAVSALEHVESERKLEQVLERMVRGTKPHGVHCIIMSTNVHEVDPVTSEELETYMEVNMTTIQAQACLSKAYADWELIFTTLKPLEFTIKRNGRLVLLQSDCLTFVVQRK
ncbi:class I SAM-dependent methyltransferase [Paenibacillus chibensis]|uniref:class I SAM-dependent methyltransferase n=1 Tax=Paenibacillus chibensis TaxID=59846 RepID=UPI000FDB6C43|nr:class I SAM-dependent methyltransferase [Paenibacillus chibensis]MEC0370613.1 class I SAM-dependent methyltransferase [Paenibacillus chibensis]